jgi:predicted phosphodiesterase
MKLAVISDIHSDFPSLEKAFAKIRESGADRILCLGDIVGYSYHYAEWLDGRDSIACIEMVKQNCDHVICGNHDLNAAMKLPLDYKDLGMPANWYDMDLSERTRLTNGRFWMYQDEIEDPLNDEAIAYLSELPETLILEDRKFNFFATHFIYPDLTGSCQDSPVELKDFREHLKLVQRNQCRVGLAGHAHPEGYAQISRKALGMNYFRKADLIRRPQILVVPAITRSRAGNGYLIIDTEKYNFEAVPLS